MVVMRAFSLTNPNNRVDLGAYQYFLTKEGNNWVLVNSQKALDSTSSVETNVPDNTGSNNAASNNPNVPDYTIRSLKNHCLQTYQIFKFLFAKHNCF